MRRGISGGKIFLIGWDGADWKIIHRLIDEGKMPNMARFVEEGVIGNLATLYPELSPMLWTSIATGKRPYKHGILGFTEPDPQTGGIRPITSISRKTKAIWNILSQEGRKCVVVGWWPSHPAEPINGVMVSNHYQRAVAPYGKPWPMKPGTVHPRRLIRNLAELRLHPQELDVGLILNFLPRLSEIDQEKDRRVENLAKIIADCTTVNRAVTAIMDHEPWDFVAVYYDALDHFSHGFMNYHPPRLPWVDEKDFELYKNVVESGYIYHDILLGTLLQRVDENTTVMIVSDHGFHSDHLRPKNIPREPAGPAAQHRYYGIFAVRGPGIKRDEIIYGASLLDICPTLLTIIGLPVGEDMDGKPLVNIFEDTPGIRTIPSWDEVPGDDGRHPPDALIDPMEAKEALEQLIQLGYIDRPDENREKAARECVRELRYNLARSYMDAGLYTEAVSVFEELVDEWPDEYRFGIQLVSCYKSLDRITEARKLLEEVFKRKRKNAVKAREELREFRKEIEGKKPEDFTEEEKRKLRNLRAEASTSHYAIEFLMGSLLFAEGKKEEALKHLKRAERADRNQPALYNKLGDVYVRMKRYADAETAFARALEIDPDNAEAHLGLARTFLGVRKNRDAAGKALNAVGLLYHNPRAHYVLGVALHRMRRIPEAVEALRVAVSQNPNYPEAYRRLAYIYGKRLNDPDEAKRLRKAAREARQRIRKMKKGEIGPLLEKEVAARTSLTSEEVQRSVNIKPEGPYDPERTVVVVSGLPRSGTSMMMQMLEAGGILPLTDRKRRADEDNPRGYYEYEKAKSLARDSSWVHDARGKAVKIVAQLLPHLPVQDGLEYRIIFMTRDLDEVVRSQRTMLRRQGKDGGRLPDEQLKQTFSRQMNQVKRMLALKRIPIHFVDYGRCINEPGAVAGEIDAFLGGVLDQESMTGVVDPALWRQRAARKPG